jgi:ribose transport system permease protein
MATTADPTTALAHAPRRDWARFASRWGTIASLVLLLIVFSVLKPDVFATSSNLIDIVNQVAILGVIALGLTVPLVMGQFDLSIAGVATLAGYVACKLLADGGNLILILLLTLAIAGVIGVLNGYIVGYLGISAFIATLAMGQILNGVVLGYSKSETVLDGIPSGFLSLGQDKIGPIPVPVVILAIVAALLWVFLERTEYGRHMYAIGSNQEAARLSGIRVRRYALIALAISAVASAIGGMVVAANLGVGRPQGVGDTYLLDGFTAVFIGAATLRPGTFHILGTVVGVLLIGVITNGLSILGVATFWQLIIKGVLLIAAIVFASLATRNRR